MKEFWNSRTIYRKVVIVAMALQFIGWFLIPFAEMYKGAAAIKNALIGLGTEVLPDKFTMFSLGKFMMDMDSSDWIFYWSVIIINAVLLVVIVMGQKRASYVISYICWHVVALFAGIGMMAGGEVYGYEGKPLCTLLIYAITAVVFVGCLLGAIFEYKAQAKLAARLAEGYVPAGGPSLGNIDTEKLKAQAGNIADTGAAVAKKTAKMAVKGFYKASEAAKDFVESAKNESGAAPAPQPKPAPAPQPKPAPAPQPIPAPAPQPKPAPAPQPIPAPAPKPQTTFADDPDKTIMLPQTGIPQTGNITGIRGMFAGAQIPIGHGESVIIGRAADSCHIILTGQAISRKHCVVQYDGTTGNYLVTDYSANGTFLGNGSKLPQEKSVTLTPGSVIWIGNNENTFQLG